APARADGSCVRLSALTVEFVWHRPQNSAVAGQESKRPPIGGSLWHERRTCLLSQHKSPKAGYCSRFPLIIFIEPSILTHRFSKYAIDHFNSNPIRFFKAGLVFLLHFPFLTVSSHDHYHDYQQARDTA